MLKVYLIFNILMHLDNMILSHIYIISLLVWHLFLLQVLHSATILKYQRFRLPVLHDQHKKICQADH